MKASSEQLRQTFDRDVSHFTNLEQGQESTMDSRIALDFVQSNTLAMHPQATAMCDIGCGGGNFAMRVLRNFPGMKITLLDLSKNMLETASARVIEAGGIVQNAFQGDIREVDLPETAFDIVTAGAVLHHLRSREEWHHVLPKIVRALKPRGTFWMWDLVRFENPVIQAAQEQRYAEYLCQTQGNEQQKIVFQRIEQNDTPETTAFITQAMRESGFKTVEILHQNAVFCLLYGQV